jgi:nitrogen fixation protein
MVDDRRTRQVLGYGPKKTLEETVLAVDEGRW